MRMTSRSVRTTGRRDGVLARATSPSSQGSSTLEHLPVKEQQGGLRLILRRGRDLAVDGKMGQEALDVLAAPSADG